MEKLDIYRVLLLLILKHLNSVVTDRAGINKYKPITRDWLKSGLMTTRTFSISITPTLRLACIVIFSNIRLLFNV